LVTATTIREGFTYDREGTLKRSSKVMKLHSFKATLLPKLSIETTSEESYSKLKRRLDQSKSKFPRSR
jgi:hypothetical protein